MNTVLRTEAVAKLEELGRGTNLGYLPYSMEFGKLLATHLEQGHNERITSLEFVGTYLKIVPEFLEKSPGSKEEKREENLVSLMGGVAEEVASKAFSDEVFKIFQEYIDFMKSKITYH